MKKQVIEIGQLHEVEFLPSGSLKKDPICRINGMVCFIHNDNKEDVKQGQTWYVSISEIKERYLIVMPVYISLTEDETENKKREMLKVFQHEKTERSKQKKCFVYKSFQELRAV